MLTLENAVDTRIFTATIARRALMQGLPGAALGLALAPLDADAKKKHKRKGNKKRKKKSENPPPPPSEEDVLFALINAYRQASGLGTLIRQSQLEAAARFHAEDMATNNYFSDNLTNGDTAVENIASHGYTGFTPWAVNRAGGNETASATLEQWKASPPHNANLRGAGFREIGVARAHSATALYGWYWIVTLGAGRPT